MTTIPVTETAPSPTSPTEPESRRSASRLTALRRVLRVVREVLAALLGLARLRTRTAWAEICATSPGWFPRVFLAWCGVAAVLATAFGIWVVLSILIPG